MLKNTLAKKVQSTPVGGRPDKLPGSHVVELRPLRLSSICESITSSCFVAVALDKLETALEEKEESTPWVPFELRCQNLGDKGVVRLGVGLQDNIVIVDVVVDIAMQVPVPCGW